MPAIIDLFHSGCRLMLFVYCSSTSKINLPFSLFACDFFACDDIVFVESGTATQICALKFHANTKNSSFCNVKLSSPTHFSISTAFEKGLALPVHCLCFYTLYFKICHDKQ